jgi:hypothetical protein
MPSWGGQEQLYLYLLRNESKKVFIVGGEYGSKMQGIS